MSAVQSELLTAAPHAEVRRAFLPVIFACMAYGILSLIPFLSSPGSMVSYLGGELRDPHRWVFAATTLGLFGGSAWLLIAAALCLRHHAGTGRTSLGAAALLLVIVKIISTSIYFARVWRSSLAMQEAPVATAWAMLSPTVIECGLLVVLWLLTRNRGAAGPAMPPHREGSPIASGPVAAQPEQAGSTRLQYFAPVAMPGPSDPATIAAALRRLTWGMGILAVCVGGVHCVSFLIAHGSLYHAPYRWPWKERMLTDQLVGWGSFAFDLAGPLLLIGGVLALRARAGTWRFLAAGAVLLSLGVLVAFAGDLPRFFRYLTRLAYLQMYTQRLARRLVELIPPLLILAVAAQRAVRQLTPAEPLVAAEAALAQ